MYVSFDTVGTHNQVAFNYYFDFQKERPLFSSPYIYGKKSIFHTEYQKNYFDIFFLGRSGSLENKFNILKENGYITYPNDASFFLWYPRLGSHIKIYNDSGEILWKINESRYLKISQDGKYILAFSGDASRIEFLRPDMSSIVAVEGFLLHSYELQKDTNAETQYQACVGFLNGDIALINLEKSEINRLSLKKPLKALSCNFEREYFVAQVGEDSISHTKVNQKTQKNLNDTLIKVNFKDLKFNKDKIAKKYEISFLVNLPQKFTFSLPITSFQNYLVGLIPVTPNQLEIQLFDIEGETNKIYRWPDSISDFLELEDFRIDKTEKVLIVSSESTIILLNNKGILHKQKFTTIKKILVKENSLFIQTKRGVLSLKI